MNLALIDSDILSEVLRAKNPTVAAQASDYLDEHGRFAFSAITYYELLRGLRATGATRQLANFERLAASSNVIGVSIPILDRAASLWAQAQIAGRPKNDADLIIAATALESGRVLLTGNTGHFDWVAGLAIQDWRQSM